MRNIDKELERLGISETPPTPQQLLDMIMPMVKRCVDEIKIICPDVEMTIYINSPKEEAKGLPYLIDVNLDSLETGSLKNGK